MHIVTNHRPTVHVPTDRALSLAGKVKQSAAPARPSVCLFPLYLLNHLTFELKFLYVYGSWFQLAWN